jgi:hypothetical protein
MSDQRSTQEPFEYINDVLLTAEELSEEWSEVAFEARMKLRVLHDALVKIEALEPLDVRPSGGKDFHRCRYIAEEALHPRPTQETDPG